MNDDVCPKCKHCGANGRGNLILVCGDWVLEFTCGSNDYQQSELCKLRAENAALKAELASMKSAEQERVETVRALRTTLTNKADAADFQERFWANGIMLAVEMIDELLARHAKGTTDA